MRRLAVIVLSLVVVADAHAARIDTRTKRVSPGGGDALRAAISDDGHHVIFDADAGGVRNVFVRDLRSGAVRTVSAPAGGTADGLSLGGTISEDGTITAFASVATNLVADDTNQHADVFAHIGTLPPAIVSVTPDRGPADGDSSEPDLSANGRFLAFSSGASNLVAGDSNSVRDVFVCDLATGAIRRVSQTKDGTGGDAPSGAPAISPDGRYVSFTSDAGNLVADDSLDVPDVLLADLQTGAIRRVSVSSRGREQEEALRPGHIQASDVSRGGRFVVFDSDASNLVAKDDHRHSDIFLRDVRARRTTRLSTAGKASNGDSFSPRISPDGRFVVYASAARNLFPVDVAGPNTFLTDRRQHSTTLVDAANDGRPKRSLRALQQRPSVAADGNTVAFTTAARLVGGDAGTGADAYVRRLDPPRASLRVRGSRYRVRTDDPQARLFVCDLRGRAGRILGFCPQGGSFGFVPPGRYTLTVRAWGAGLRISRPVRKHLRR